MYFLPSVEIVSPLLIWLRSSVCLLYNIIHLIERRLRNFRFFRVSLKEFLASILWRLEKNWFNKFYHTRFIFFNRMNSIFEEMIMTNYGFGMITEDVYYFSGFEDDVGARANAFEWNFNSEVLER